MGAAPHNNASDAIRTITLSPEFTPGTTHVPGLTKESAETASKFLTINHELYHNRWASSFHNHTVHHLLSLWSLGATPAQIQDMWDLNQPYQAQIDQGQKDMEDLDLSNPTMFSECLGKTERYLDFLRFFRDEVEDKGIPETTREYVLKGDGRANDIFCRMYADLLHPMIHLGCALEFNQPSLLAEALAAACTHKKWPKVFLLSTEEYVRSHADIPSKSLLEVLESMRLDPEISQAVKETDPFNKIADGLITRVTKKQFARHLSQYRVDPTPEGIARATSEMMHTSAYVIGAAQKPGKKEKIDFVLLHNSTLAVHYPAFMSLEWISYEDKARLLEQKARVDAVMYAGCGCPELFPQRILDYTPEHPEQGWPEMIQRSIVYRDEGHAAKLIRALYCLEQHFSDTGVPLPIGKEDFSKIAHMTLDSIESSMQPGGSMMSDEVAHETIKQIGQGGEMVVNNLKRWIFYDGLPNAWQTVPDLCV